MKETPLPQKAETQTPQIALTVDSLSELRVKVAELCRWTNISPKGVLGSPPGWTNGAVLGLPNYPSDLNACAEMRRDLSEYERYVFAVELITIATKRLGREPHRFELIDASAAEQCQAFVATKALTSASVRSNASNTPSSSPSEEPS